MEINKVSLEDNAYLSVLLQLSHPPKELFYLGTLPKLRLPSVAIVGTRKPTSYGKEATFNLAYNLAKKGIVVISGLAYGIDAVAHRAALDAGGITIAVLANGLDTIYPASHLQLAKEIIAKGGAIISEYPAGVSARDYQFLARNRLVSGLADAVVVTEAAARSGTLSTINHALDQNREVFAVPGNINSLLSVGPNSILQQGAHVALSAQDIITVIAPDTVAKQTILPLERNSIESTIVSLIEQGTTDTELIQRTSGIPHSNILQSLTLLEIAGTIKRTSDNSWTIT